MDSNLKILMTTMSMDIGGAETHILELCKLLAKRGYSILLVSNGGVYVKELEEAGVTHIKAPLHRRDIPSICRSYFILKRIIKQERPDIVHAHARIPGFVCGLIRKTVDFKFVTTAHWVFEFAGLQGKLTNWGQQTMAVSEDIKQYLTNNYSISEKNIFVTINGIDTVKFSPEISGSEVACELSLGGNAIVHVSRLDSGRAMVAGQLIDSAEHLAAQIDDLSIIIVGGGNLLGELGQRAAEVNMLIGRNCIVMAGSRTDINSLIAAGTIFVGVSRAALEAMSEAKPVIVAGDEGYIGIFDESSLDIAYATNFCCRGCDLSSTQRLTNDILSLMQETDEKLNQIGQYCRDTVKAHYSATKMTDDYEIMYHTGVKPTCRVLISGYYGYRNAGDDAILHSIKQSLYKMSTPVEISVLSHHSLSSENAMGYRLINRFSILSVLGAIRHCDLLISGGGSLLQDKTSTRSLMYYLFLIRLAKLFGKKVILFANGIGPINKPVNRKRVKKAVLRADIITLRERSSLGELISMGVEHPEIHVTADPVFLLDVPDSSSSQAALRDIGVSGERPVLGVSVRSMDTNSRFKRSIAELFDYASRDMGMDVLFIVMQSPDDVSISSDIRKLMTQPSFIMDDALSPEEIMGVTGKMSIVVSMRLHTIVFAAKEHVPVIGIDCDPKIAYYLDTLGMPTLGEPSGLDSENAKETLADMFENLDKYSQSISEAANEMQVTAKDNELYLKKAVEMCRNCPPRG